MIVIGKEKQEKKLSEIAKAAKEMFPDVNEVALKGALRFGAKDALEKSRFSDWKELATEPPSVRKEFFNSLLQEAAPRIEMEIGKDNMKRFMTEIHRMNEKYVRNTGE